MRAFTVTGPSVGVGACLPDPFPGPGEVLVAPSQGGKIMIVPGGSHATGLESPA